jgi:hypothetical protein
VRPWASGVTSVEALVAWCLDHTASWSPADMVVAQLVLAALVDSAAGAALHDIVRAARLGFRPFGEVRLDDRVAASLDRIWADLDAAGLPFVLRPRGAGSFLPAA